MVEEVHMLATVCMQRSEPALDFHHVVPGDGSQLNSIGNKYCYPLSHLAILNFV